MNRELEELILAYEALSQARDTEEEKCRASFDALLDKVLERQPGLDRQTLTQCILRAHRQWLLKQAKQPPSIPPKA